MSWLEVAGFVFGIVLVTGVAILMVTAIRDAWEDRDE